MEIVNAKLLSGDFRPLFIATHSKRKLIVDQDLYMSALKVKPSTLEGLGHSIRPRLDGKDYNVANEIVRFINMAALGSILADVNYPDIPLEEINALPAALAIIDWCDDMLVTSKSYENYKAAVIRSIKHFVQLARSVVTHDDSLVGGAENRIELLKRTGLPIKVPEFLKQIIVIPAYVDSSAEVMSNSILTDLNAEPREYRYGTVSRYYVSDHKPRAWVGCREKYLFKDIPSDKVSFEKFMALQAEVSNHIYSLHAALVCKEEPDFLCIPNFGTECETIVRRLLPANELSIGHPTKKADICHVFTHGLADAVEAEYE